MCVVEKNKELSIYLSIKRTESGAVLRRDCGKANAVRRTSHPHPARYSRGIAARWRRVWHIYQAVIDTHGRHFSTDSREILWASSIASIFNYRAKMLSYVRLSGCPAVPSIGRISKQDLVKFCERVRFLTIGQECFRMSGGPAVPLSHL
jgi:hypothetical protein